MFDTDIFIFHIGGFGKGLLQYRFAPGRNIDLPCSGAANAGKPGNRRIYFLSDFARRSPQFAQHGSGDAAGFREHRGQQMLRFNLLVMVL